VSREQLLAERRAYAATILAGDVNAAEGLLSGQSVPRSRLHRGTLIALGEPLDGAPIALDNELALRVELTREPVTVERRPPSGSAPRQYQSLSRDNESPPWFERASDLLGEDDPGPTPFLVEDLIVEGAVAALVGAPKAGKTWTLLEIAIAIASGTQALGSFAVPQAGPVLVIVEESGRRALHRRLDSLSRGRALSRERLSDLYVAANRRVRLDDDEWRKRLLEAGGAKPWRLIAFDPFVRVKGAVDENVQREVGPVLDFLRELRDVSGAAVAFVQHTPHDGKRMRGTSDFEAYWESKVTVGANGNARTLDAEHREAERAGPFELSFRFDSLTRTLRLTADEGEFARLVREYLEEHPDASANVVDDAMKGVKGTSRTKVLELVKRLREGGSSSAEPPGTTAPGQRREGGSPAPPFRGAGTTPTDPALQVVPGGQNHSNETVDEDEIERLADLAREMGA